MIGAKPLALAVEGIGWRETMLGLGVITLVLSVVMLRLIRDPVVERESGSGSGLSGYLALLKMPVLWLIIPLITVNYAPAAGIRGLWLGPYLADVYDASTQLIGDISLWMAISMVIGSLFYGPLDTFFKTRKWVCFVGNGCGALALVVLALFPMQPLWQVSVLMFAVGIFGASFGVLMAHARSFFPMHLTGRGVTLMNFFTIGGVGLAQFAMGQVAHGRFNPTQPEQTYSLLFAIYAAMLGITLLIYVFSSDRKPGH